MSGNPNHGRLQLIGDRAAWLRRESVEVRRSVLADPDRGASYWAAIDDTAAWRTFVAARRAREIRDALLGRRRKGRKR